MSGTTAARGAVAEAVVEMACTHCGLPVPSGLVEAGAQRQFCCAGCHTAFAMLHEHGLERYYGFRDRRAQAVTASGRSYDEFDHAAFAELYVRRTSDGLSRTELYLEGVHCSSCVWLVERVPLLVPGVQRAVLDVRRSLAVVEWDADSVPLSQVARTLDQLGYAPHPFRGVARDDMRRREDRAMMARIGVSGAIAINVMLAALALYSGYVNGMEHRFTWFFRWLSFALTIPTFVWPGRVFFTGAWAALRTRTLHMDLPIAIALAAGFVRGAYNTITDTGPVYFDGLCVLIFALLVGRFLQQRGQRIAADSAELLYSLTPGIARIVEGDVTREVPAEAVLPGMLLDVRAGESFPADGIVASGHSTVNMALLTGESRPASVATGEHVYAGTLNVAAPLRVRVEQAGELSRLSRLLRQVEDSAQRRAPVVLLANRLAGFFVAAVLTLAVVTFAIRLRLDPAHAADDAIALLIVTCPCALALATPLAITVAVGRAARRGLLVKGGDAIEQLAHPGTLVLDKTGTITEGRTALVSWVGSDAIRPLVLALEEGSSHPIADGFRRAWSGLAPRSATNARHVSGGGLEGDVDGHHLRIGSPRFVRAGAEMGDPGVERAIAAMDDTLTPVLVSIDGVVVAAAGLGDRIRDDAQESLTALRARGWRTVMLSGDVPSVVRTVGARLGFAPGDLHGAASPEDKLAFVERARAQGRVVMVGDGVNDAAAIAAASVGVGMHGGAEACLATADIYLARPGLNSLVELIDGSRRTMRVIRRNIAFSLTYNAIGATLAVIGVINPLIAAVLMPVSSLTVVLASYYGFTFSRAPLAPEAT